MNEAYIVRKIITQIKKHVPQAVVLKINDRSTAGIPDISVDYGGRHLWVEVKLIAERETEKSLKKKIDSLQLATCRLLEQQGNCRYFLAFPHNRAVVLTPHVMNGQLDETKRRATPLYTFEDAVKQLLGVLGVT